MVAMPTRRADRLEWEVWRVNTLLNYPGAKWGMAAQIVSLMPPHRSYLEPFFGSGAVDSSCSSTTVST